MTTAAAGQAAAAGMQTKITGTNTDYLVFPSAASLPLLHVTRIEALT